MEAQVLVIGGGIAGGIAALGIADRGIPVVMVRSSPSVEDTSSYHAQGGIIYQGDKDSSRSLGKDIWNAGARCGDRRMIRLASRRGPEAVERILLDRLNIPFDKTSDGCLSLTREGGHRCSRIIHARDATGRVIMEGLDRTLTDHPQVVCLNGYTAIELLMSDAPHDGPRSENQNKAGTSRCWGARVLNEWGGVETIISVITVLATGGAGKLYRRTSNPPGARGEGVAMANRAGARISDMEYIQFHPTALALPHTEPFLISEAARGAGARLVDPDNIPFMEKYSPGWGDLAPRDIVTRAIYEEMRNEGKPHVNLDFFNYLSPEKIIDRFPTIYRRCKLSGIDITNEQLPVAPAAHFSCGGITVNRWAETSVPGLFALGECSRTGIHGANRLASTSLLEGVIWADRASRKISRILHRIHPAPPSIPAFKSTVHKSPSPVLEGLIQRLEKKIQHIMWGKVGIIRETGALGEALEELKGIAKEADQLYFSVRPAVSTAGLRNMAGTAVLVARAAFGNRISRGCHFLIS